MALTIVFGLSLLHLIQEPSGKILENRLAEQRAEFGDPYKTYSEDAMKRIAVFKRNTWGNTRMLFPAGVSSRRYYLNNLGETHSPPFYLVLETKGGSTIRVNWIVKLNNGTSQGGPRRAGQGTLEAFLARQGLYVPSSVTRDVRASIKAVKPFASYRFDMSNVALFCGYLNSNGVLDEPKDVGHPNVIDISASGGSLPITPFPYPIVKAERQYLRAHHLR
jgi:hypothetical protein